MFADDLGLCREVAERHGPLLKPMVDVGGLSDPTIADYSKTIAAMADIPGAYEYGMNEPRVHAAQYARYQRIHRPLSFLDSDYRLEDPGQGGVPIEGLSAKYGRTIGTAILLSVLEHVDRPWEVPDQLVRAMVPGGLIVVSVPWTFPHHPSPEDHYRYSPTGLRHVFTHPSLEVLESDWRLDIPAEAGVLCTRSGRAQIVQSAYLVARVTA